MFSNKNNSDMEIKKTLTHTFLEELSELISKFLKKEKANRRMTRQQYVEKCGITMTTLYNMVKLKKFMSIDTVIRLLDGAGYKIIIVPKD